MKSLRALAATAVAVTTVAAPVALTGGVTDAAVTKNPAVVPTHMRVVTLNTAHWQSDARALADVRRLVDQGIGVIALQEMQRRTRRDAVRSRLVTCPGCRYGGHLPKRNVEGGTPVLWRKAKFSLVEAGNQRVTPQWYVGPGGAGPSTVQQRYVTWVKLQERRSGRMLYVLNTHFVASVQGPDGGPNSKYPRRLAHYRAQMRGLQNLVRGFQQTGLPVVVTGDFNVNYRRDKVVRTPYFPYAAFEAAGMRASYFTVGEPLPGSHVLANGNDTRLIDYVAHSDGSDLAPMRNDVLLGYGSDHRPVLTKFELG
jgi:endonuclease/exonuclease/phosphatase (EEP) superfamily protein YafD